MRSSSIQRISKQRLGQRLCDLNLSLEGTWVEECIHKVLSELSARGIQLSPTYWVSDEWFCADGTLGFAVPFYLLDSELMEMERQLVGEVEGGTKAWCSQLIRHELGHVVDNAFDLRRSPQRQTTFGPSSRAYPSSYVPQPYSRQYVKHLDSHYAQSHPDEDFAETFAVWLGPKSRWRHRYAHWPALRKLEVMDILVSDVVDRSPVALCREPVDEISTLNFTLGEHYRRKRQRLKLAQSRSMDQDLRACFGPRQKTTRGRPVSEVIVEFRRELVKEVAESIGLYCYFVDQVIQRLIQRSRELNLVCFESANGIRPFLRDIVTSQALDTLLNGRNRIGV